MKTSIRSNVLRVAIVLLLAVLAAVQLAQAQTPLLQLKAANYNPTTGAWSDSSGNNDTAQASGAYPTLTASASPNGSAAVVFNGANLLILATSLPAGSYTVFAYIEPATGNGPYALLGGVTGAFEHRIYKSKQDALVEATADLGSESTALSTSAFSLIDCTVSSSGGSFRLNGAADGTNSAATFTQPITSIGARATDVENFSGTVCEIDIYSGVLTPSQISTIEAALTAAYVTALPASAPVVAVNTTANPSAATAGGNDTLYASFTGTAPISYQWQVSPNANGSGAVKIAGATSTTLVLTNPVPGNYYSLQATNSVAPYVANSAWLQLNVAPLTPLVQLIATNYDGSSVWTDTSGNGNNATYSGSTAPTLASFVTPNGGSAVNIASGSGSFVFGSTLAQGSGYTVFAYAMPSVVSSGGSRFALAGGAATGALEYDFYQGHQNYLVEYTGGGGAGTATIPTSSFSSVNLAVNSSGGAFRLNGAPDGNVAGAAFSQPLARIGNNHGGGDGFVGDIAEIDIYSGVLTYLQITNIEAQLTAKYVTANSIVIGAATVSPTNNTFAGNPITLGAPILGATATTTFHWQTDNGSGGQNFANISGATSSNYVLNTTSLVGTYEYQLIGTPFGGGSVTSAPVNLTVQSPSAPLVWVDTAPNPANATIDGSLTFSAAFVGNLPINYQWQVSPNANGSGAVNIAGATNLTLGLYDLQLTNAGYYYSLRATNVVSPYAANSSWVQLTVQPLTALVQLQATNYNPSSGVWTDSSPNGNNATYYGGSIPTLAFLATPNGGPAVNIASGNNQFFLLNASLDPSSGYTVFAYLEPATATGNNAITGGSTSGALEYHIHTNQVCSIEYVVDVGHGVAAIPATNFSMVDLAVNSSGGAFRLNGASDGSISGATFNSPITRVANNEGGGDGLIGNVAEIDIYSGVLTPLQISNVEAQLTAEYVTVSGIVIGAATVSPTNNTFAGNPISLAAPVVGPAASATFRWQTDNGSGGAAFANISGATSTNYLLNTTSLLGTYEYQLVGTPFGGNSVTSPPVALIVQSASAPSLLADTAPNPATATVNGAIIFSAAFVGNMPIGYQWQVSANSSGSPAVNLAGATNATLVLNSLQLTNSGYYYSLRATNAVSPYVNNSTWVQLNVEELTPLVQLHATNYNPISGVWTDSSPNSNNATYGQVAGTSGLEVLPTLFSAATLNGSPAVNVSSGNGSFVLTTPLDPGSGYTVFAYIQPASTSGRNALTGGSSGGALEYDIYNGEQDYLEEYQVDVGHGNATIPTAGFSLVSLAVNSYGGAFGLDGLSDASIGGATFGSDITRIGNNEGGGDGFTGNIAEIDIYSGVLSYLQITNVEAQLMAAYGAVNNLPYSPTNLTTAVVGSSLQLNWPASYTGWTLEAQTNSLGNGLGTNWVPVANSTTVNTITVPLVPRNGSVFYRLQR